MGSKPETMQDRGNFEMLGWIGLENWWGGIAGERISERVEAAHWEGEGEGGAPRATTNASGPLGWRWRRLPARV